MNLFLTTFWLIFLAEFPDKTAMATLLMAARGRPWAVFVGVSLAFVFQSAIAVCFGSAIGRLPAHWVHSGAGVLFLLFAIQAWRKGGEAPGPDANVSEQSFWATTLGSFWVIFLAEWGDITQLASASLVARYHTPWIIFSASSLALISATATVVLLGHHSKSLINPRLLSRLGAVAFAAVGIYLLVKA